MEHAFRPHVLVVDDDASVREALSAALHLQYVVHAAATGAEACAVLRRRPVAVVILDALLGETEHGLDVVPRLREIARVPILVLTGHSSEDLAIRAVWANLAGYLKKPIGAAEVRAAVERILSPAADTGDLAARARRALDSYPQKTFRVGEVAAQLGVSEGHLRRLFRAAYGRTLRQYLTEVRVRRAAELLRSSTRGIKQAAHQVGFTNLAVFRRVFKQVMGRTPKTFATRVARPRSRIEDPPMSKT